MDRDCGNCIHKVPVLRADGTWSADCESWNCEFLSRKKVLEFYEEHKNDKT